MRGLGSHRPGPAHPPRLIHKIINFQSIKL